MNDLPIAAKYWPDWVRDRFLERVAMMREGNRISDEKETPRAILMVAMEEAEQHLNSDIYAKVNK